jgi:hypothetical protein
MADEEGHMRIKMITCRVSPQNRPAVDTHNLFIPTHIPFRKFKILVMLRLIVPLCYLMLQPM